MIVTFAVSAVEMPSRRIAWSFVGALFLGIVAAVVFGLALPNRAYAAIGDVVVPGVDPAVRPLIVGAALLAIVFALIGFVVGAARLRSFGGAIGMFIAFGLLGAVVGAVTAISFDVRSGIAIGIAVTLVFWPIFEALGLRGYDWDALKNRYIPHATIDTTKESLEWVRGLTQRSPKP